MADFRNLVSGFGFGGAVNSKLDISYEFSAEGARNFEEDRTDRLRRSSITMNWRITPQMLLNAVFSGTLAGDLKKTSRGRNGEIDLQWSYRVERGKSEFSRVQTQFFVRYANRYARTLDNVFSVSSLTKVQTLNTGLNITFF